MLVREIMHSAVKTCRPDDALQCVAMIMWNDDCGAVPVVDDQGHAIGLLTERDIVMAAALTHRPLWDISAREIHPRGLVHGCRPSDDIHVALRILRERRVSRLLVLNDSNRIEGIVSLMDVLDHLDASGNASADAPSDDETVRSLHAVCRPTILQSICMTSVMRVSHAAARQR